MSKVHPAAENKCQTLLLKNHDDHNHLAHERPSVLTVWKRSSMSFQGTDGFTVFDNHGRLTFRVDNYSRKNSCVKGGLVLMDGAGKPLLTLKPQVFSIQYQWNAYRGSEEGNTSSQRSTKVFSMRSKSLFFQNTDKNAEAEVFFERAHDQKVTDPKPDFRIEGCFWKRNCKIRNRIGEVVANIARKKVNDRVLLGDDVFSLVVQPGFDAQLIMSFVIILDRICGKPYAPVLCS
ncbi:LURP1-related protein domain containing protein [Parasponia andersonii]|uniref:LURP1-related protein domain containing protein n=1 Tax=Parasponia andersonii TaxID=3476 RepID=A0A2P5A4Y3_PARAD|nr:LURP1-related protein domain containing protein [Parasponia andersonii]